MLIYGQWQWTAVHSSELWICEWSRPVIWQRTVNGTVIVNIFVIVYLCVAVFRCNCCCDVDSCDLGVLLFCVFICPWFRMSWTVARLVCLVGNAIVLMMMTVAVKCHFTPCWVSSHCWCGFFLFSVFTWRRRLTFIIISHFVSCFFSYTYVGNNNAKFLENSFSLSSVTQKSNCKQNKITWKVRTNVQLGYSITTCSQSNNYND